MRLLNSEISLKSGYARPLFAAIILAVSFAGCQRPDSNDGERGGSVEDQIRFLSEEFVHTSLALQPSTATGQGYHESHGVILDEQIEDFSLAGLERARKFYRLILGRATHLAEKKTALELKADLEVIRLSCQYNLLDLDRIQSYRHNPTGYVEIIGNAIYQPLILNYAPESKRLAQIIKRIEKIPGFLETAKKNLVDSPEVWNHVAQAENEGNLELIDHTIRARIPAELKTRYEAAAAKALGSLKEFNQFLEKDLSQHASDWRMGQPLYGEKFKLALATGDTPQQTLKDAESRLASIREEMHKQAVAVYPKFFPGAAPPSDLNTVVSQVLDKIAQQHATPQQYFQDAKRDLAETTEFVRNHNLLRLPASNGLQVIPTPQFMQGIYAVGGFAPAPVFEPQLGSYFWITPFTPDMTASRIESKLREYNTYGLKILTIHEAMPGHYVQFEFADDVQPPWRRTLRALYSNGPYVEGWAVYATELMINAGYTDTPEMRLTFAKQMLRVVSNTILDVKLQTMGMTDQQALDLMVNDTFQEKEEAEKKLQRAKLSSCQLPTYFVGWRGWDRLRDRYKETKGRAFEPAEFHERALKQGGVPLPTLTDLLLQADGTR